MLQDRHVSNAIMMRGAELVYKNKESTDFFFFFGWDGNHLLHKTVKKYHYEVTGVLHRPE